MVRLREDHRFHFGRDENQDAVEDAPETRHVRLRRASSIRGRRLGLRSVSWLFFLFVIVLMAIILLR